MAVLLALATAFLAYANGANDNFKGVATLFGSGTTNYRRAIGWATVTTFAGSMCSLFLAERLLKAFSGKGLVPDSLAGSPQFLAAVAFGAAVTVMFATRYGLPISTTHGLVGGLTGAGLAAVGMQLQFGRLGKAFLLPLLASPLMACGLAAIVYVIGRGVRRWLRLGETSCAAVGSPEKPPGAQETPVLDCGCDPSADDPAVKTLDALHFLSAGAISFARGVNDTPKVVAVLLGVQTVSPRFGLLIVAIAMALGGLLNARRVAETMSRKITPMSRGQGFAANIVAAFLVLLASRWGVPVSTTHVTVGGLFGIGVVGGRPDRGVIRKVVLSWVLTLPMAAAVAWIASSALGVGV